MMVFEEDREPGVDSEADLVVRHALVGCGTAGLDSR